MRSRTGCARRTRSESSAHKGGDGSRPLIEVGRREPQDLEACVHQEVLASVVVDETVAVVGAVVLDDQLRVGVVEVGSGYLSAAGVV